MKKSFTLLLLLLTTTSFAKQLECEVVNFAKKVVEEKEVAADGTVIAHSESERIKFQPKMDGKQTFVRMTGQETKSLYLTIEKLTDKKNLAEKRGYRVNAIIVLPSSQSTDEPNSFFIGDKVGEVSFYLPKIKKGFYFILRTAAFAQNLDGTEVQRTDVPVICKYK